MTSQDMTDYEVLSIIGLRFEIERELPEFFFLAFTGNSPMLPLMQQGRILTFTNRRHVKRVIALAGCEREAITARRDEVWFGVGRALSYLERESVDNRACIIEVINLLDDLMIALDVERPSPYAAYLDELADYLTFRKDLGAFFATAGFDRKAACDALRWCIGTVVSRMTLLPHIIRR